MERLSNVTCNGSGQSVLKRLLKLVARNLASEIIADQEQGETSNNECQPKNTHACDQRET